MNISEQQGCPETKKGLAAIVTHLLQTNYSACNISVCQLLIQTVKSFFKITN